MSFQRPLTKWSLNKYAWANEERLPGFGKLLEAWLSVHTGFCEGAHPYFSWDWGNNERSQIGLLANASTLIGGVSLEESWIEKDSDQGKKYSGRSDLWLRLSPSIPQNDYLIEAKLAYVNVENGLGNSVELITQQIQAAHQSAMCLKGREEKIVAVAFLSLMFSNTVLDCFEPRTNELMSFIKNLSQSQDKFTAIAAIWMGTKAFKDSQLPRATYPPGWKNKNLGMVLLASHVKN